MPSVKRPLLEPDRRLALKLMAIGAAGLMARCSKPDEEIIPYADMPEGLVPGEPARFATTLPLSGYGRGFLAISVDGRPIKVEGNPRHPFSLGATDVFAEAEVLNLYDPDRSQDPMHEGRVSSWHDFTRAWQGRTTNPGLRVGLVTGRVVAPTTLARITALKARFPALRWYRYEPVNDDASRAGAELAFDRIVSSLPRWADADVVLSLSADPLGHGPEQLSVARAFSTRRAIAHRQQIYVAEPTWTLTGAAADFRLSTRPEMVREIGRALANALGANLGEPKLDARARAFAGRATKALLAARGRALVLAGEGEPKELHALCHWMNEQLGAPIDYYMSSLDPVEENHGASLTALAGDLHGSRIDALIVADANPIYDAPGHLGLEEAIARIPFSAHLGLHRDETARSCQWHLPLSHALESWGDARAPDGTASIVQPLIQRFFRTRTRDEFLALVASGHEANGYELTRATWGEHATGDFDAWWRGTLSDGLIANSATQSQWLAAKLVSDLPPAREASGLSLILAPDPGVWDGRFANNPWLQECPKPFSKQVWGDALRLAPEDARRLGIKDESTVDIEIDGARSSLPAIIMPGQADGIVAAHWGHGRKQAGRIGTSIGVRFVAHAPEPFDRMYSNVTIRPSADFVPFRSTQAHTRLNGATDKLFQIETLREKREQKTTEPVPNLLGTPPRGEYAWAMVVDNDACIGCNACVVACQAENNVPVVGPAEISQGRDMHWLRVDGYERTAAGSSTLRGFEPVPCMHCELAPCEPVCPVEASVHDREGLNVQVYNRCIGTRFCEANCPYKVRRFNWFAYAGEQAYGGETGALKAQHNPDVSARGRGVMEKCNYCLQRISRARRDADREYRRVAEGEMVTACQAACPVRAIHFGDLNDPHSDVSRLRKDPRHFTLLEELNTRPRTTYLKRIDAGSDEV